MTDNDDTQVNDLLARKTALQAELGSLNEQLKLLKVSGKRGKRGRAAGGTSLADALVNLLRSKGPQSAGDIITALTGDEGGCKDTSVRTLLSTLAKAGKISRTGKRGSYEYVAGSADSATA